MLSPPAASLLTALQAVLVLCAIIAIGRWNRNSTKNPSRASALLSSRWTPAVAGIVTFAIVRIVWGSFHEPGTVHDERAYLLQADIFARGHWTAPAPPLATFFEQMHVFIEPAVFAKYPPAHALTLAPGIWLGYPGLIPAAMVGLSGAFVFALARRLANEWTATITWWLWTTSWATLLWSASYLSETTSAAMWLIAVWATLRWLDRGRPAYLLVVSATLAWGLAARPLTMVVLSVPVLIAILRRVFATRQWTTLAAPAILGLAILLILPAWNHHTLGDWRRDPYPQYSRVYFPFDKPGFGVDPTPPLRPLVPELAAVGEWSRNLHGGYTLRSVPRAFIERLVAILIWCSDGWRLVLGVLILAGVRHASGVDRAGVMTVALLLLAYLSFAHPPMWIVYYFEVLPILYFLAAREIGRLVQRAADPGNEAAWATAMLMVAVLLLPLGANDVRRVRAAVDARNAFNRSAEAVLAGLPPGKAIVFVSYPPSQNPHVALTRNEPDLASARQWLVYDRGAENAALRALAPDRAAYRLDAATMRIERLP
jgi:Dolichyl-phosphate-mannose-protein mannosyltransferase